MRAATILLAMVLLASAAGAERYYCLPTGGGSYSCTPVNFEIREFRREYVQSDGLKVRGGSERKRCSQSPNFTGNWICEPFDKGAVIMEPEHACPEQRQNWFSN